MTTTQIEKLSELTPTIDNYVTETSEGLSLYHEYQLDKTYVLTPRAYTVPARIEAIARTDSSNIRLKYGNGQLIFNWERNHDSLRCSEPAKGSAHQNLNGRVPVQEWNHFVWEIEPTFMRVTVNGEERLFLEGNFSRVKGQAGIGSAFRSRVDVKSFSVKGEETDPPPPPLKPLMFEYDEVHISVPEDAMDTAVQWYTDHLGLTWNSSSGPTPLHPSMKGKLMQFPHERGSLYLVSVPEEQEHFRVDREHADQFHLTLKAQDIRASYDYAQHNGIRTSSLYAERDESSFHMYDPFGNRLTIIQGHDAEGATSGSGIYDVDIPVIRVRDLEKSVEWYTKLLGLRKHARMSDDASAMMRGFYRHNGVRLNVLKLVHDPNITNPGDSCTGIRHYFYVERHNLNKAYAKAQKWCENISPLEGRLFHFYDPDGNRINIFS